MPTLSTGLGAQAYYPEYTPIFEDVVRNRQLAQQNQLQARQVANQEAGTANQLKQYENARAQIDAAVKRQEEQDLIDKQKNAADAISQFTKTLDEVADDKTKKTLIDAFNKRPDIKAYVGKDNDAVPSTLASYRKPVAPVKSALEKERQIAMAEFNSGTLPEGYELVSDAKTLAPMVLDKKSGRGLTQEMYSDSRAAQIALKSGLPAQTSITIDNKADAQVDVKYLDKLNTSIEDLEVRYPAGKALEDKIMKSSETGLLSPLKVSVLPLFNSLGIEYEEGMNLSDLSKSLKGYTLKDIIADLKGATSDKDILYAESTGLTLADPRRVMLFRIKYQNALNRMQMIRNNAKYDLVREKNLSPSKARQEVDKTLTPNSMIKLDNNKKIKYLDDFIYSKTAEGMSEAAIIKMWNNIRQEN